MIFTEALTLSEVKQKAISELKDFSPSPQLDVNCILCHILSCDKTFLLLHHKDSVSDLFSLEQTAWFSEAIEKRKTGLPVAYITGAKEFYGNTFHVTPDVLIPKPDTEILVEEAVHSVLSTYEKNTSKKLSICDMCTGSGCIGISVYLALKDSGFPLPHFTLADISEKALNVAAYNFDCLIGKPASGWKFVQGNLFENITDTFDLILTNPPYIPASMVDSLLTDGRSEPRLALDGDIDPDNGKATGIDDGLGIIKKLLPQMFQKLNKGGLFLMETGEYNAEETARLAASCGFTNVTILKDLEGQLRVVKGYK